MLNIVEAVIRLGITGADPGFVERGGGRRREALLRGGSASSLIRGERGARAPALGPALGLTL